MDITIFSDLFDIGLHPIPLQWDTLNKDAKLYPEHGTDIQSGNGKHDLNDVKRWLSKISNANGIALKLHPPFFMFDFDLKNASNKEAYTQWLNEVNQADSSVLSKCCIEKTRSGGFHVYANFKGVSHKIMLAASKEGREVISIYTGGLLSFCYPTPGYELVYNEFVDIQPLTQDEFDIMSAAAERLNEFTSGDSQYTPGEKLTYPDQYEALAVQFDIGCTDDLWENLLNSIDLFPVQAKRNKKEKFNTTYYLYKRDGSAAFFSAKVRFDRKLLFIFSGSYNKFPNFHTRVGEGNKDTSWHITPTRLLYYRNGKDWIKTVEEIKQHCETFSIAINEPAPTVQQPLLKPDRLKFPFDIFPQSIQDYINCQRIQKEYIAGGVLAAAASAIGNTCWLEAQDGYLIKPILYLGIVAPPGASKTPALNKAFSPLEFFDKALFAQYQERLINYKQDLSSYEKDKKNNEKPNLPDLQQVLIKDSTIEMVIKILSSNPKGCCILADELIGFMNRMNQYKSGDEVQKWLELWSGSTILLQRITREANRVEHPCCSLVGGIQPGVLKSLSAEQNEHNGFYHRFLFLYPDVEPKVEWAAFTVPGHITYAYRSFFEHLLSYRNEEQMIYTISDDANSLYKEWFDFKNQYYNKSQSDNVRGIISKYQDYCLRFALIIEVMDSFPGRDGSISQACMEKAIRLTEYFLGNMHKALKILAPESPVDNLQRPWQELLEKMPDEFTTKEWVVMAGTINIKPSAAKMFLFRETQIVRQIKRGEWEKIV